RMTGSNVRVIDSNALVAKKMEEHSRLLREREAAMAQTMPEDGDEQGPIVGNGDPTQEDPTVSALIDDPESESYVAPSLVELEPIEPINPDAPGTLSPEEIREECQKLINDANLKAQDIIDDAKANAQRIKESAIEEGYNAGKESALQELLEAKRELEAREEQIREEYDRLVDELEPKMVEAITDVYAHVFGNNFFSQRDVMVCLVNKALRHVDTSDPVMIEVSNEDYDMLIGMKNALYDKIMIKNEPEIVRRDDFKRGQAKIETPYGIIDCSIDTELTELTRYLKMLSYEGRKSE
ncbi:MAG: hypothetical protein IKZ39_02905, partial [Lachnospiraceae bacterium]|nr:hypothetical protein [Lachnospiraceae bacterium]